MKKKQWLLALFMALSFVFASCSGLIDGIMGSNDDDDDDSSSSRTLTITVDNYADVIDTSSSTARLARMIAPESYKNTDVTAFWVYGSSSDGETLSPKSVSFTKYDENDNTTSEYSGDVTLDISNSNWNLTLVAVVESLTNPTEADVLAAAVLIGRANVDLRTGSSATFTLVPDGLTKEANVTLSLSSKENWFTTKDYPVSDWTVTAGIYDRVTGEVINDSNSNKSVVTLYDSGKDVFAYDSENNSSKATVNNYSVTMNPGTYLFRVIFANNKTKKNFVWNDTIRILPGKDFSDTIAIRNLIGIAPVSPASFYA